MRIQAKRIKLPAEQFRHIHYPLRDGTTQIDTLIRTAQTLKMTPLYCLYVHSLRQPLGFAGNSQGTHVDGCMIGHAAALRAARNRSLNGLLPVLAPWHVLVCPCAFTESSPAGGDFADVARSAAESLATLSAAESARSAEAFVSDVHERLPDRVTRLQAGLVDTEGDLLRPRGLVVVRELPGEAD